MAPPKGFRTYSNKNKKPGSKLALDNLLVSNIRKRLKISINSPGTSRDEPLESTFDRLLNGEVYNDVAFKKFPDNNFTGHVESASDSLEENKGNDFHESIELSSSKLTPMVILERNLGNSPFSQIDRRKTDAPNHNRSVSTDDSTNISNSAGTETANNHNGVQKLQEVDSIITQMHDCHKMILMESLQLHKSSNDSTYFNFRNSLDTVSTPKLRNHKRTESKKLPNSTNPDSSHGETDNSSVPHQRLQTQLEELSTSRNGIIRGKEWPLQNTSVIISDDNQMQTQIKELSFDVEENIEHPKMSSSPLPLKSCSLRDQSSKSLLSESLKIINEWSNRLPTPTSFRSTFQNTNKCKNESQGSKNIPKRKTDHKIFKKSRVILRHNPHIEKIVKENFKSLTSHDLKVLNVKSISNNLVGKEKKRNLTGQPPLLRDCLIQVTPLKLNELQTSVESPKIVDISSEKFFSQLSESRTSPSTFYSNHKKPLTSKPFRSSEVRISEPKAKQKLEDRCSIDLKNTNARSSLKHKCSDKCDHFRKIPKVMLQRCKYISNKDTCYSDIDDSTDLIQYSENDFKDLNADCDSSHSNLVQITDSIISINTPLRESQHDLHYRRKTKDECLAKIMETYSGQFRMKDCFVKLDKIAINGRSDKNSNPLMLKEQSDEKLSKASFPKHNSFDDFSSPNSLIEQIDVFKTPLKLGEFVSLAPGKKFRRSIAVFKKNSDDTGKSPSTGQITFHRRQSVKLIPVLSNRNKISELASIALNHSGYKSLRQSFGRSSLEKVENYSPNVQPVDTYLNYIIKNTSHQLTARDIVLKRCGQTEPLSFEKCYPTSVLQHCQKIGEGVFGEVFMIRDKDGSTTVMKVIPIEGKQIVNLEKQKTFEEIISEIIISMELSNLGKTLRNNTDAFVKVKGVRCVQGCYPDRLLELWDLYDENKQSENDSPQIFPEHQLYIAIELANAGKDLEAFQFNNAQQALAVFEQITCALAVAESQLQFEHRDLHWGNVLITPTEQKNTVFVLDGKEIIMNNRGTKATIIDFTLSRIEHGGVIIFNDLSMDEDLFTAKGDYQFDIYRKMQENNGNQWQSFEPFSNILWLHYILDKALRGFRYKNTKSKLHKTSLATLRAYEQKILESNSATDFVLNNFISNILIE